VTLEDYAHIIDFLPQGLPQERNFKREPVAYALGSLEFKLFELVPKPDVIINMGERVYIGKEPEKRDKILHVKRRVSFEELTAGAQSELPYVITEVVKLEESRFIKFFNESQSITIRQHMLELLPGLGKKTMMAILDERKKGPFVSFAELSKRVHSLKHPEKVVSNRILVELNDPHQKYHLFVSR
jgi:putative nucleotide binding protein